MIELTQVLSEEHQNILKVIEAIKKECQILENSHQIDQAFFAKAIDFIINYADKFHHAKEEDILFKAMCQDETQMHCNPTEQMRHEHDLGRDYIKNLRDGLEENNIEKILSQARGYAYLLEDHIFKEDNILYPMADQILSPEQKQSTKQAFIEVEQSRFSPDIKEKYLAIVKFLSERA